jgi:hypothetical protein
MNWKVVSYSLRAVYLLLILLSAIQGRYSVTVFNGIIFLVTLIVPLLARRNERYYPFDCALMLLFILPMLLSFGGYVMHATILGEDKIFHFAGGALLAWFGAITLRPYVKNIFIYVLGIICFAVTIGAWWEVYEWTLMVFKNDWMRLTLTDSVLDIVADSLGAVAVAAVVWRREGKKRKNN